MSRFFNSLQIQLYAIVLLLTILVAIDSILNVNLVRAADASIDQSNAASLQRSNAYLLASLARRFVNAEVEREVEGIRQLLDDTVARVGEIENSLRIGSVDLEIPAIEDPDVLLQLEALDTEWDEYLLLVDDLFVATEEEQPALLTRIDQQSVTVFNFADRLLILLDFKIEQQQEQIQQVSLIIGVITAVSVVAGIFVVTRIVRSVNELSGTARTLASGDLSARAKEGGLNEIAQVGSAFNTMANRLDNLVRELETQVSVAEKARATAEQSDQVKSAFLASMSHELRTPLNSVINFTKFVVRGVMGPVTERQTETLNKVVASGQHLLNLINDVLDMSKIESGSLNLFVEDDINLTEIMDTVVASGEAIIGDKPVALKRDIAVDLPMMRGDRKRLTQIFLNVVSNACKFTQEGYVKITAKVIDGTLHFTVQDTGPGIEKEDQQSVFEPFRQTDSGLRQGEGTGLGMPISQNLTQAHGGRLWFESTAGEGTTFFVTLPVKSEILQPVS